MGGPGRGSGLEAEQAGVGPGAGSPSEPTVLRDVELPEPRGEAMAGVVGTAGGMEQKVRGSPHLSECCQPPQPHTPGEHLCHQLPSLPTALPLSSPILSHQGSCWASGLHPSNQPLYVSLGDLY